MVKPSSPWQNTNCEIRKTCWWLWDWESISCCLNDKSLPKSVHPTFLLPHRWDKQDGRGNANTRIQNTKSKNLNIKFWGKLAHRRLDKRGWRENANGSQKLGNSISIGIIPLQLFAKLAKSWNSTNYHSKRCFAESAISIYLKKIFVELILEICFCICTDLRLVLESGFQFISPLLGERSLPGRWQGPSRIHNCTDSLQKYKIHKI